jgi:hypothetical protein
LARRMSTPRSSNSAARRSLAIGATLALFAACRHLPPEPKTLRSLATLCESSKPYTLAGHTTGFETCSTGMRHRPTATSCPSLFPRKGDGADFLRGVFPRLYEQSSSDKPACLVDSDCTAKPHGFCMFDLPPVTTACWYGCIDDSECAAGQICLCDEPVGHCAIASCKTDTDCGDGYVCGSYEPIGAQCGVDDAFACQTPMDQCAAICRSPGAFCTFQGGRRTCANGCDIY